MDLKTTARWKRAHFLQHKKAAQKPRPQIPSSSNANRQNQNKEKARLFLRTGSDTKASFLSLDLHALVVQLEWIDVSKRLLIEEDLLPIVHGLEGVKIYDVNNSEDDVHPLARGIYCYGGRS
ncbi:uncharacterized protein [Aristolochia californica]|uniref:uncharacterized protein n=1 Tax=Aristolochia californica TaxID=171875 RepID=UPI0035DA9AD3